MRQDVLLEAPVGLQIWPTGGARGRDLRSQCQVIRPTAEKLAFAGTAISIAWNRPMSPPPSLWPRQRPVRVSRGRSEVRRLWCGF